MATQNTAGYPNHGQLVFYVYTPAAMVVVALGAFAIAKVRKLKVAALVIEILGLSALLPFLLYYTGGV